jgi:hypothetical protein
MLIGSLLIAGLVCGAITAALAIGLTAGGHGFVFALPSVTALILTPLTFAYLPCDVCKPDTRMGILRVVWSAAVVADAMCVFLFLLFDVPTPEFVSSLHPAIAVWLMMWFVWQLPLTIVVLRNGHEAQRGSSRGTT